MPNAEMECKNHTHKWVAEALLLQTMIGHASTAQRPSPMRRIATLQTEYVDGTSLKYNNHSD